MVKIVFLLIIYPIVLESKSLKNLKIFFAFFHCEILLWTQIYGENLLIYHPCSMSAQNIKIPGNINFKRAGKITFKWSERKAYFILNYSNSHFILHVAWFPFSIFIGIRDKPYWTICTCKLNVPFFEKYPLKYILLRYCYFCGSILGLLMMHVDPSKKFLLKIRIILVHIV